MLLAAVLGAVCSPAHTAPAEAATEQVRATLVASVDAVYPGAEVLVGVNQRIIPRWHTYWKNPGDSGLATSIAWKLPAGAMAGEILWPVPRRFSVGPVTSYAYADEVTLLSPLRVPQELRPGDRFPVAARVKWLVCEETCIPHEVELGLDLPVVSGPALAGSGSPLVQRAQASLPLTRSWPASVADVNGGIRLRVVASELASGAVEAVEFFPEQWGRIVHNAPQTWTVQNDGIELKLQPGEAAAPGTALAGILLVTERTPAGPVSRGFSVQAQPSVAGMAKDFSAPLPAQEGLVPAPLNLPTALILALSGGLILNLMPCVFPVLSLKALALLMQSQDSLNAIRLHGLVYSLGVLASFGVLGVLLIVLKAGGAAIGWGFQFQSPLFVLLTADLIFAVGLALSGVINVGAGIAGVGSSLAGRGGYLGSFFTGVLASVVAAPCTAPFMGAAVGYAVTQPPAVLLAVLLALGLGLALPFLILSCWPGLRRLLPRPGAWMETLKQGLAFPMYATTAWLLWVLAQQAGTGALAVALAGLIAVAFAAWIWERSRPSGLALRRTGGVIATGCLGLAVAGGYAGLSVMPATATPAPVAAPEHNWEAYSEQRLRSLLAGGQPVFLNFTAAWCISCLVNEKVALSAGAVSAAFRKSGITYLKGDWTSRDDAITAKLAEFDRSGVPLYVFYPAGAGNRPAVLPQILTPQIVLEAIAPANGATTSLTLKE
ncbi:MAG: thiol:disulfide interchange protein [Methylococcaceae bacterium]|nr:thiol:disulfide interchange protein [Methylococcaceae bacterium]